MKFASFLTDEMGEFWLLRKDEEFPDLFTSAIDSKYLIKQEKKSKIDFVKILKCKNVVFLKELRPYRGCQSICRAQFYQNQFDW